MLLQYFHPSAVIYPTLFTHATCGRGEDLGRQCSERNRKEEEGIAIKELKGKEREGSGEMEAKRDYG